MDLQEPPAEGGFLLPLHINRRVCMGNINNLPGGSSSPLGNGGMPRNDAHGQGTAWITGIYIAGVRL